MAQQVVTGEAVALDLRLAALPSRVVAGLVDAVLQGVLLFGIGAVTVATGVTGSAARAQAFFLIVVVAIGIGYPVALETLTRGRTPGKALLGLRVVRDDGGPIGFRQAFARGLVGFAVERPGVTAFSGAVICSLLNQHGKRLGDLLAGTVVLQERIPSRRRGGQPVTMPPELAAWAAMADLSRLDGGLVLSIRQLLARFEELTPAARHSLASRLAGSVAAAVTPAPPPDAPVERVLAAVLAERRRRADRTAEVAEPTRAGRPAAGAGPAGAGDAAAAAAGAPEPPPPTAGPGGFVAPR